MSDRRKECRLWFAKGACACADCRAHWCETPSPDAIRVEDDGVADVGAQEESAGPLEVYEITVSRDVCPSIVVRVEAHSPDEAFRLAEEKSTESEYDEDWYDAVGDVVGNSAPHALTWEYECFGPPED